MKQILGIIYARSIYVALSFRLSFPLRLVLILLSGLTLTGIGLRTLAQSTPSARASSNPFLEYTDMFPGQSSAILESKSFSCTYSYSYQIPSDEYCQLVVPTGIFSRVEAMASDHLIHQTTFTMRDDTMKIGDLILLFGSPNFRAYPRRVFFFWTNLFVIVSTTAHGNPSVIRPVWSVTFTDSY